MILTRAEHAEVLRQMPGPIYYIVEGDPGCIGCFDRWTHAKIHGNEWLAPSRFVKATGPCETCDGCPWNLRTICCSFLDDASTWRATWDEVEAIRRSYVDPPMEGHERVGIISHCSDCIDGRKRAELRATAMVWDGDLQRSVPERFGGSVLFAHATVEVLPVVDALEACRPRTCLGYPHCDGVQCTAPEQTKANALLVTRGPCWLNLNGVAHRLDLDPLPVPGRDWIVVLDGLLLA